MSGLNLQRIERQCEINDIDLSVHELDDGGIKLTFQGQLLPPAVLKELGNNLEPERLRARHQFTLTCTNNSRF